MKVSIITAALNNRDTIEDSILSVLSQKYDDIEYIVVDGGSTDGTVEVIRKYASDTPLAPLDRGEYLKGRGISQWVSEPDGGIYHALNKGLKMATGDVIGCFGLTEPYFGSNPTGMITRADRVSGGYRLNGVKRWITNGTLADVAVVWAKLDGDVRGFLVDKGTKGFTSVKISDKWSLRASVTAELFLEDCVVPEDAILPDVRGMKGPLSCLSQARYGICWGVIGAAIDSYEVALSYAKERKQFSRPIAGYQLVQRKLADMVTEITKAQCLTLRLGRLKEAKKHRPAQISLAKRNNVSMALDIARMARDILGGNGIMYAYSPGRHMLNLETVYTYEGTHDIHTLIIGQDVTGIAAFE